MSSGKTSFPATTLLPPDIFLLLLLAFFVLLPSSLDWPLVSPRHFLASVSPNCKYDQTVAALECGGEVFSFTGKKLVDPGFTEVFPWQAIPQVGEQE